MIELFKPYKIDSSKVHLGPREDGGYVTSTVALNASNALFTFGVGNDVRYEKDYTNTQQKPVYLFDHTIGQETGSDYGGMHFFNIGLGYQEKCKDFINIYNDLGVTGRVLLKVDIEGGEYDYLEQTSIEGVADITTGILIEFHWLSDKEIRGRAIQVMNKILNYFTLVHVHGNNWAKTFDWDGLNFPDVIELSFVNNALIGSKESDTDNYPTSLDYPNAPHAEDYDLNFLTKVETRATNE